MIDTLSSAASWGMNNWNGTLALILYWVPALFCVIFYFLRTIGDYDQDSTSREKYIKSIASGGHDWYVPKLTVGVIIGRALLSIIPVANLFAALFDLSPKVFRGFINTLDRVFNQPLVPHPNK